MKTEEPKLSTLERAALEKLLAGEHAGLELLRNQISYISNVKRVFTGVGFLTNFVVSPEASRLSILRKIRFGDVVATSPMLRNGVEFLLYVDEGAIAGLEGFTIDEAWPDPFDTYELGYVREPRDLSAFDQ